MMMRRTIYLLVIQMSVIQAPVTQIPQLDLSLLLLLRLHRTFLLVR